MELSQVDCKPKSELTQTPKRRIVLNSQESTGNVDETTHEQVSVIEDVIMSDESLGEAYNMSYMPSWDESYEAAGHGYAPNEQMFGQPNLAVDVNPLVDLQVFMDGAHLVPHSSPIETMLPHYGYHDHCSQYVQYGQCGHYGQYGQSGPYGYCGHYGDAHRSYCKEHTDYGYLAVNKLAMAPNLYHFYKHQYISTLLSRLRDGSHNLGMQYLYNIGGADGRLAGGQVLDDGYSTDGQGLDEHVTGSQLDVGSSTGDQTDSGSSGTDAALKLLLVMSPRVPAPAAYAHLNPPGPSVETEAVVKEPKGRRPSQPLYVPPRNRRHSDDAANTDNAGAGADDVAMSAPTKPSQQDGRHKKSPKQPSQAPLQPKNTNKKPAESAADNADSKPSPSCEPSAPPPSKEDLMYPVNVVRPLAVKPTLMQPRYVAPQMPQGRGVHLARAFQPVMPRYRAPAYAYTPNYAYANNTAVRSPVGYLLNHNGYPVAVGHGVVNHGYPTVAEANLPIYQLQPGQFEVGRPTPGVRIVEEPIYTFSADTTV